MTHEFFDLFLKGIESGNWVIVFALAAVALISNFRVISEFLERRESRHVEFIKDILKIDALTESVKSVLEEELNYFLFKKIAGIPANRALRDKLKDIVDRSDGEIQIFQLTRAKDYIEMKDGKLRVVVHPSQKFQWYFNWFLAIVMTVAAVVYTFVFFMLPFIKDVTFQQLTILIGFGFFFFMLAIFLAFQTIPLSVAWKIEPIIKKLESSPNNGG